MLIWAADRLPSPCQASVAGLNEIILHWHGFGRQTAAKLTGGHMAVRSVAVSKEDKTAVPAGLEIPGADPI